MTREQSAASIRAALGSVRDVAGVHGSFVLSEAGELIAKDLPSVFDDYVFAEVGPRVARLWETFASVGDDVDGCLLRFAEHKLFLRWMNGGTVGVLLTLEAHLPALKMAVSLAVRRISPDLSAYRRFPNEAAPQSVAPSPSLLPAISAQATPAPAQPSRARARMVFRGHEVK